ncbi:MAG: sigma-54-dependent Fis family transcriptional regulator [Alphaproteobacteria bacterium]|nr:sigma-54-dependent Fis family transcriptional regulator [Alphaproteobacteria bacterium]
MAHNILIVDDDPTQRRLLQVVVERMGYPVATASTGHEAIAYLDGPKGADVSLLLLDLIMPGMDGMGVLRALKPKRPALPVIVLTAQGGIETVVTAMRAGADDFLVKPASPERIQVSIQNALKLTALTGEITRLKKRQNGQLTFKDLIARAGAMRPVIKLGERAAQSNIPILIEGESGVGKELIARAIQGTSDRAGKPFVAVNCGAIPEHLIESILFGHEKGAFTGATDKHIGKFQEADGGTLFLDEIGELRLDMQVKLLRALQEGEVDPVGSRRPVKIDIRLISATNRNLTKLVADGLFREDLFYRLNVFPIQVPPLRERGEDIPALVEHFIERFAVEENKKVMGIEEDALGMLMAYQWPGNVRQLENTVFRAVVLCDVDRLQRADFPQIATALGIELPRVEPLKLAAGAEDMIALQPRHAAETGAGFAAMSAPVRESVHTPVNGNGHGSGPAAASAKSSGGINFTEPSGHLRKLEEIENELIRYAIERYAGHMSEVARRLGIGRSTLYRKIREMGLNVREDQRDEEETSTGEAAG